MSKTENFLRLFPLSFRKILENASLELDKVREIRIRAEKPLLIKIGLEEWTISQEGHLSKNYGRGIRISLPEVLEILEYLCGSSIYAYEEELKKGYLTVQGGHRIGVCGSVTTEKSLVKTFRYVSSLNIRMAHEIKGAADDIYQYLHENSCFYNTLLISGPGLGKTTLLRDIVRQASGHGGQHVCVIDERSEIAGCYMGLMQNDLGMRTDVLDNCLKAEGMMMAVRAMGPDIVAVDEIGSIEDVQAIRTVLRCGCRIIATVHGETMEDLKQKPALGMLLKEQVFERYVLLGRKSAGISLTGTEAFADCIQKTVLDSAEQVIAL
ncbi:MAG: stage III sporulation protein AA [Lachnospiraceae bacterium]